MNRGRAIVWGGAAICVVLLLVLFRPGERTAAPVFQTIEAPPRSRPPVALPPGVIRPGFLQVPLPVPRMAARKDVSRSPGAGNALKPLPKQSGVDVIPNEFSLSFRNEADRAAFIEKARAHGVEIVDTMKLGFSVLVRTKRPQDLQEALAESPAPAESSSNHYVLSPEIPKKDPMKPQGDYQPFGDHALKWLGISGDNSTWGRGVVVAVLDNGITSHPALREDRISRVDLVNEKAGSFESSGHAGHGNAIASIIAGNGGETEGVAPSSTLLSVKVLSDEGVGDSFTLAKGIVEAVDRGARVLSMSLGTSSDSYLLKNAVDYALRNGVAVVAAVGNEAIEGVSYPARYDGVVAVTAVDANGQHPYFANRGKEVGIAAPGIGITAAWTGSDFVGFSGTSAAVPFVSGAISYLLSENPGMTAGEAAGMLVRYADDLGAPGRDDQYGNGALDIQRVMERNQKGIYDIAAGDVYVPPQAKGARQMDVILSAQNRGTEIASVVEIKADLNGMQWSKKFTNVAVGQTVSMTIPFDLANALKGGGVGVNYSATINGVTDRNPVNNQRRGVILTGDLSK